jgi:AraC-like DNA-binding protein
MTAISLACSCHAKSYISKEEFTGDHIFSYLITGINTIDDGQKKVIRNDGSFVIFRRNRLAKIHKKPPLYGEYRSISVRLGQDFLKSFSQEYNYVAQQGFSDETIINVRANKMLQNVMESLVPYFEENEDEIQQVLTLKAKELVFLLLRSNPDLKNLLFDFNMPGRIDLEKFMNANFHFNVSMDRFAHLTGRSLTSFKRDFKSIFNVPPGRWLLERRLKEAYHLISIVREKPSEVFLKVGFEDLSHFSFAFKNQFGIPPSALLQRLHINSIEKTS